MGSFGSLCPARITGYTIQGSDLGASSDIKRSQLKAEEDYIFIPFSYCTGEQSNNGVFPTFKFDEASVRYGYGSFVIPDGYGGSDVKVIIPFITSATSGEVKIVVDIASVDEGSPTSSENTQNVVKSVGAVANTINLAEVTFNSSYFSPGNILGIKVTRDGSDVADTITEDIYVLGGVYLSFNKRG